MRKSRIQGTLDIFSIHVLVNLFPKKISFLFEGILELYGKLFYTLKIFELTIGYSTLQQLKILARKLLKKVTCIF